MKEKVTPDTKEQFEAKIKELEREHGRFQERIVGASKQRRDLQKQLQDDKDAQRQTVKEEADRLALDDSQSVQGYIQKVLQVKASSSSTRQLEDNIDKLLFSEERSRERQKEITAEIKDLRKKIRKIKEGEALRAVVAAEDAWYKSVVNNEKAWVNLKSAVKRCHGFEMNYALAFKEYEIDNPILFLIMMDKLRPQVVDFKKQSDLLNSLSSITQSRPNKYFIQPGRGNERRIGERKSYDPKRDNFIS